MYDFFNFLKAIAIVVSAFAIYMFLALLFKKDFGGISELLSLVLDWLNTIYKWINIIVSSIAKFIVEVIIFGAIVGIIIFGWKQLL
jgi:hypothetical protein